MAQILIVDDDPSLLRSLRGILEDEGHHVTEESDGPPALRSFASCPADLVITDMYMPEMNGIELLMRLREKFPEAKVIGMSGCGLLPGDFLLEGARALGADGILAKPLDMDEVVRLVASVLSEEVEEGSRFLAKEVGRSLNGS